MSGLESADCVCVPCIGAFYHLALVCLPLMLLYYTLYPLRVCPTGAHCFDLRSQLHLALRHRPRGAAQTVLMDFSAASNCRRDTSVEGAHMLSVFLLTPLLGTSLGLLSLNWYPSQVCPW